MRFMSLVRSAEDQGPPPMALMEAMGKGSQEQAKKGVLVETGGLAPSAMSTRVRVTGGKVVVTDGPFRYSRNPIYLGMFIMLAGWAIYLGSISPWFVAALFVYAIRTYWVPMEEMQMEREMGERYMKYKSEVRRWL